MKQYELVQLNIHGFLSGEKDVEIAQELINLKAADGWELLQIISPNESKGAMYGVFVKEIPNI